MMNYKEASFPKKCIDFNIYDELQRISTDMLIEFRNSSPRPINWNWYCSICNIHRIRERARLHLDSILLSLLHVFDDLRNHPLASKLRFYFLSRSEDFSPLLGILSVFVNPECLRLQLHLQRLVLRSQTLEVL